MISLSLSQVAARQCEAAKPRMNLRGFVEDNYRVSLRFFEQVASGQKNANAKLLTGLNNAHVRLFPTEPVLLILPGGHPPVLLGNPSTLHTSN